MAAWWESLVLLERVFFCVAIPATLILVIQTVLLLFGAGHDDVDADVGDADGDIDGWDSGLRMFTVRGFVAFFSIFGWSGLVMYRNGVNAGLSIALAVMFGALAMLLIALLMRWMLKLQQDGTMDVRNAIGKTGSVYLTIPPARQGQGKVSLIVQDSLKELNAVTDGKEAIPTGSQVRVVRIEETVLVVKKL